MSQAAKPTGFFGRLLARGMAWGHRSFYKNTARVIDLHPNDVYLEIGFGSGLFIKKYASHVSRIVGLDYSEDMIKLASNLNKDLIESGKAEFIQGDVSSLPWNENEFTDRIHVHFNDIHSQLGAHDELGHVGPPDPRRILGHNVVLVGNHPIVKDHETGLGACLLSSLSRLFTFTRRQTITKRAVAR